MNLKIKKRFYLVSHLEETLELLSYYKSWAAQIRDKEGAVLWTAGEEEGSVKLNEITG